MTHVDSLACHSAHTTQTFRIPSLSTGLLAVVGSVLTLATATAHAEQPDGKPLLTPVVVESEAPAGVESSETIRGYSKSITRVATKAPTTLRQIPQSVSVVTRDTIEDRNYTTLDELAYGTPGLRVLDSGQGRSSIYARGFEYSDYNINGLPAPMSSILGTVPSLVAFDRVEILRGPSGLFNSTSEMGGIINLVLKRPTRDFQGHVITRYGSWNQRFGTLDLSGPLSDGLRGRVVAAGSDTDGVSGKTGNDSQTFYGTVDIDLADNTLLTLALLRQQRDMVVDNGLPTDTDGDLVDYPDSTFVGAEWNRFEMGSTDAVAELTHRFDDGGQGRVGVRYSNRNADFNYLFAGSALHPDNTVDLAGLGGRVNQQTWSADANYTRPFRLWGNISDMVVGADYKRYKTDQRMSRARGIDTVNIDQINDYPYLDVGDLPKARTQDTLTLLETYGLYSKLTLRPVSALALIGGLRLSAYDVDLTNNTSAATHSRSDSAKLTPYAGLVYDVTGHHTLYASYSNVFKPQTDIGPGGQLLEAREGHQYEAGIKSSYFDGRLHTRLTAFYLEDRNAAVSVPGESYSLPLGQRRVQGIEVEVSGALTPDLEVLFGYTHLDTKVDAGGRKAESIFMLMPQHRANLWGKYHFDNAALANLTVGAGVSAVSDFSAIAGIHAPGYAVFNAMAGYQFTDRLSAKVNVNNLFDTAYYRRVGSPGTFNLRGDPLNVVASLRYQL